MEGYNFIHKETEKKVNTKETLLLGLLRSKKVGLGFSFEYSNPPYQ